MIPIVSAGHPAHWDAEEDVQDFGKLRPRAVHIQLCTQNAHYHICLRYPFPQKLRVRRVAHLALVVGRICIHRVKVLHVRLPGTSQYLLLLLDLQPTGKFRKHIVQKLVVRQRMHRVYPHVTEQPVVDVAVQLLQQFRAAQACVHLQEHQRNLALWVKYALRPIFALMLFSPKFSAISYRGSFCLILPSSLCPNVCLYNS